MQHNDEFFLKKAIEIAKMGMRQDLGGPFGAVVVKDGEIVGQSSNLVTSTNDPTAHAEVSAIRDACKNLATYQLDGCVLYTSCEPCPMCLGAIYWARPERVVYAATHEDADEIAGFDDKFIYEELDKKPADRKIKMVQMLGERGKEPFLEWKEKEDKKRY
ncbi:MAG: nucleoside deaminase [Saprospiraceae bacterium]